MLEIVLNTVPIRPKDRFLVFASPLIEEEEITDVVATMRSGWIGTGPKVRQFEELFCHYQGSQHSVALSNCTSALHLALLAAGIGKGDEVLTTPMTFCATVNAIIHSGATPVLADCEPDSMNISPEQIEAKITPRTKAVLIVHFAGRPCNMDAITAIVKKHRLLLIEDCAHAIETEYRGKKAGMFGDMGCFSFYVTKNVMTGEGGMVVTNSEELAGRIKILALHGLDKDAWGRFSDDGYKHYQVVECGYKYNMTDLQAAIGIPQLRRLETCWRKREAIWQKYNEAFAGTPLALPKTPDPDTRHAYHLYTVLIDERRTGLSRDEFLFRINRENIGVGVHYMSIPEHPYYQERFGWRPQDHPNAFRVGRQTASLPLSAKLTDEDVGDVIKAVLKIVNSKERI